MPIKHRDGKAKQQQRDAHRQKINRQYDSARALPEITYDNPYLWVAVLFVAIGIWRIGLALHNPDPGGMGRRYRHKRVSRTRTVTKEN